MSEAPYIPSIPIADQAEAINRRLQEIRAERGEKPPAFTPCAKCGTPFSCQAQDRCDFERADEPARDHAPQIEPGWTEF